MHSSIRRSARLSVLAIAALATPVAVQAQSIGNARVEVQGGWDGLDIYDQTGTAPATSTGGSRGLYGVGAGYDLALGGPLVVGVDSNFDLGGGQSCQAGVVTSTDQLCGKLLHDWDIGARLGVKAGSALVYGRVAYDDTKVRTSYLDGLGNTTTTDASGQGVRLAAGLEYNLGSLAYLKGEYRYTPDHGLGTQNQLVAGLGLRF